MGPGQDGGRRLLDLVLHQWPTLVFVPAVLVLVVVLVVVTRVWDARDQRRLADAVAGPRTVGAAAPVPRVGAVRRWWRHRTRCRCSWHTAGTQFERPRAVG